MLHKVDLDPNGISAALASEPDADLWCKGEHQFSSLVNSDSDVIRAQKCTVCGYVDLAHQVDV